MNPDIQQLRNDVNILLEQVSALKNAYTFHKHLNSDGTQVLDNAVVSVQNLISATAANLTAPQANKLTVAKITPTAAVTINTIAPSNGAVVYLVVTTSGVTSYTITFGANFKSTGTLATGVTSGKVFVVQFVGDGTNLNEVSRTTAM